MASRIRAPNSSAPAATQAKRTGKPERPVCKVYAIGRIRGARGPGQPIGELGELAFQGGGGFRSETVQMPGTGGLRPQGPRRGLFNHYMGICPAEPEGADGGPTRHPLRRRPGGQFRIHEERGIAEGDGAVGFAQVQRGWEHEQFEGEHDLEHAGDAGGGDGVADIGFHRTDRAKALLRRGFAEGARQRLDLDGIAQSRPVPWAST